MNKPANHIDGWLYVGLGICAAIIAILDTTDAGKYIPQPNLFYIKAYASILNAAFLAAKMYRSTNFAKALADTDTASARLPIPSPRPLGGEDQGEGAAPKNQTNPQTK